MKASNNINGVGNIPSHTAGGLGSVWDIHHNDGLTPYMNAMVTKIVHELNGFDNVIYQPSIEPTYGKGAAGTVISNTFDSNTIANIVAAEADLSIKHLISQNEVKGPPLANVTVLSWDGPSLDLIRSYHSKNKPLSYDELTYSGITDFPYRRAGWEWIIAGGAVYNMLDLTFTPDQEDGSKIIPPKTSLGKESIGGGGPDLRNQLRILKDFIHGFDFLRMKPDNSVIKGGVPDKHRAHALVEAGRQYAIYIDGGGQANLALDLPVGEYRVEWLSPLTGGIAKHETVKHPGGSVTLASPADAEDVALRIRRVSGF